MPWATALGKKDTKSNTGLGLLSLRPRGLSEVQLVADEELGAYDEEEYDKLPASIKQQFEDKSNLVQELIFSALSEIKLAEKKSDKKIDEWQSNVALMTINIHVNNVKTSEVLEAIEAQTDYLFVYDKNEIDLNRKVSVQAEGQAVSRVLSSVFQGTDVAYAMEGSNIMLMRRGESIPSSQQSKRRIQGTVIDATGEPTLGTE